MSSVSRNHSGPSLDPNPMWHQPKEVFLEYFTWLLILSRSQALISMPNSSPVLDTWFTRLPPSLKLACPQISLGFLMALQRLAAQTRSRSRHRSSAPLTTSTKRSEPDLRRCLIKQRTNYLLPRRGKKRFQSIWTGSYCCRLETSSQLDRCVVFQVPGRTCNRFNLILNKPLDSREML